MGHTLLRAIPAIPATPPAAIGSAVAAQNYLWKCMLVPARRVPPMPRLRLAHVVEGFGTLIGRDIATFMGKPNAKDGDIVSLVCFIREYDDQAHELTDWFTPDVIGARVSWSEPAQYLRLGWNVVEEFFQATTGSHGYYMKPNHPAGLFVPVRPRYSNRCAGGGALAGVGVGAAP
jgi:hypothetical protein